MKVLITGAAGHVGSVVVRHLHSKGHDLRLSDRRVRKDLPGKVEVTNLLNRDGVYALVDGCDAIVHLGNHPNFHESSDAQQVYGENCQMNMNLFTAARELGVKKVVFFSSVQVINGDRHWNQSVIEVPPTAHKYLPADSDSPANPRNPYSLSKRAGEQLLEYWVAPAGVQCIAIRLPWTSRPEWWERFKKHHHNNPKPEHALLDECFAYLHADDAAALVAAILDADLPGYRSYFPAARTPMTGMPVPELIEKFYPGVELRQPLAEMTSLVDISRITRETGWEPQRHLHEEPM